ncbi:hypothetical protein GQ55_1G375700 [Panicum hallii var. hallii]|uniref:Retrotransposon gag domain-containing protein n=1 Tax=Panicum hallii var. hallii TaxID=1504633 RepID=A0A2T7FBQ2_9POAL|nr:hypothetical protein GQ55_1G375700 [Panicum hallii var. hallii]
MAASFEDIVKKLEGFETIMQETLDKVSGMEAWQSVTDTSMGALLTKFDEAALRLRRLETAPLPQTPPRPPPPPPSRWVELLHLNLAPPAVTRPPAWTMERPSGHRSETGHRDVGGGILGSHPPHPVTGMSSGNPQFHSSQHEPRHDYLPRAPTVPKLEIPKFDGDNLRLWRDRCEMFFEVYSVGDNLKTRFAALNFKGVAASWLQTVERRGRVLDWDVLCQAVFDRFDRDQYQLQLRQLDALR